MQHVQYGQPSIPMASPFDTNQRNVGSSTASLRQFRKKENVEKTQGQPDSGSAGDTAAHVARVAPHNHYPARNNEYYRYPQYPDYGLPFKEPTPVKYSEISEPHQSLQHVEDLSASVIQKHKEKEYFDMCSIPQQTHLKQAYADPYNRQQNFHPEMGMHPQYIHKEQQISPGYKNDPHQYIPKENQYQQYPMPKYNMPTQHRKYPPQENSFIAQLHKIDPGMARSIMSDHHIREMQSYPPADQSRMYAPQSQRYYSDPMQPNPSYPTSYQHRNIPQHYNYQNSCAYPRPPQQINPSLARYSNYNMERSLSPRRNYQDNLPMAMNYPGMHSKLPIYHQQYTHEYAQHYQHRRSLAPQDYYQQSPRHPQFVTTHQISPETGEAHVTASNNIRQYLENWAEEEGAGEVIYKEPIRTRDETNGNDVYVINAAEIPEYLETTVPLVAAENGQYYLKGNVAIENNGEIKIMEKNMEGPTTILENPQGIVSVHIVGNGKTDCLLTAKPYNNQSIISEIVTASNANQISTSSSVYSAAGEHYLQKQGILVQKNNMIDTHQNSSYQYNLTVPPKEQQIPGNQVILPIQRDSQSSEENCQILSTELPNETESKDDSNQGKSNKSPRSMPDLSQNMFSEENAREPTKEQTLDNVVLTPPLSTREETSANFGNLKGTGDNVPYSSIEHADNHASKNDETLDMLQAKVIDDLTKEFPASDISPSRESLPEESLAEAGSKERSRLSEQSKSIPETVSKIPGEEVDAVTEKESCQRRGSNEELHGIISVNENLKPKAKPQEESTINCADQKDVSRDHMVQSAEQELEEVEESQVLDLSSSTHHMDNSKEYITKEGKVLINPDKGKSAHFSISNSSFSADEFSNKIDEKHLEIKVIKEVFKKSSQSKLEGRIDDEKKKPTEKPNSDSSKPAILTKEQTAQLYEKSVSSLNDCTVFQNHLDSDQFDQPDFGTNRDNTTEKTINCEHSNVEVQNSHNSSSVVSLSPSYGVSHSVIVISKQKQNALERRMRRLSEENKSRDEPIPEQSLEVAIGEVKVIKGGNENEIPSKEINLMLTDSQEEKKKIDTDEAFICNVSEAAEKTDNDKENAVVSANECKPNALDEEQREKVPLWTFLDEDVDKTKTAGVLEACPVNSNPNETLISKETLPRKDVESSQKIENRMGPQHQIKSTKNKVLDLKLMPPLKTSTKEGRSFLMEKVSSFQDNVEPEETILQAVSLIRKPLVKTISITNLEETCLPEKISLDKKVLHQEKKGRMEKTMLDTNPKETSLPEKIFLDKKQVLHHEGKEILPKEEHLSETKIADTPAQNAVERYENICPTHSTGSEEFHSENNSIFNEKNPLTEERISQCENATPAMASEYIISDNKILSLPETTSKIQVPSESSDDNINTYSTDKTKHKQIEKMLSVDKTSLQKISLHRKTVRFADELLQEHVCINHNKTLSEFKSSLNYKHSDIIQAAPRRESCYASSEEYEKVADEFSIAEVVPDKAECIEMSNHYELSSSQKTSPSICEPAVTVAEKHQLKNFQHGEKRQKEDIFESKKKLKMEDIEDELPCFKIPQSSEECKNETPVQNVKPEKNFLKQAKRNLVKGFQKNEESHEGYCEKKFKNGGGKPKSKMNLLENEVVPIDESLDEITKIEHQINKTTNGEEKTFVNAKAQTKEMPQSDAKKQFEVKSKLERDAPWNHHGDELLRMEETQGVNIGENKFFTKIVQSSETEKEEDLGCIEKAKNFRKFQCGQIDLKLKVEKTKFVIQEATTIPIEIDGEFKNKEKLVLPEEQQNIEETSQTKQLANNFDKEHAKQCLKEKSVSCENLDYKELEVETNLYMTKNQNISESLSKEKEHHLKNRQIETKSQIFQACQTEKVNKNDNEMQQESQLDKNVFDVENCENIKNQVNLTEPTAFNEKVLQKTFEIVNSKVKVADKEGIISNEAVQVVKPSEESKFSKLIGKKQEDVGVPKVKSITHLDAEEQPLEVHFKRLQAEKVNYVELKNRDSLHTMEEPRVKIQKQQSSEEKKLHVKEFKRKESRQSISQFQRVEFQNPQGEVEKDTDVTALKSRGTTCLVDQSQKFEFQREQIQKEVLDDTGLKNKETTRCVSLNQTLEFEFQKPQAKKQTISDVTRLKLLTTKAVEQFHGAEYLKLSVEKDCTKLKVKQATPVEELEEVRCEKFQAKKLDSKENLLLEPKISSNEKPQLQENLKNLENRESSEREKNTDVLKHISAIETHQESCAKEKKDNPRKKRFFSVDDIINNIGKPTCNIRRPSLPLSCNYINSLDAPIHSITEELNSGPNKETKNDSDVSGTQTETFLNQSTNKLNQKQKEPFTSKKLGDVDNFRENVMSSDKKEIVSNEDEIKFPKNTHVSACVESQTVPLENTLQNVSKLIKKQKNKRNNLMNLSKPILKSLKYADSRIIKKKRYLKLKRKCSRLKNIDKDFANDDELLQKTRQLAIDANDEKSNGEKKTISEMTITSTTVEEEVKTVIAHSEPNAVIDNSPEENIILEPLTMYQNESLQFRNILKIEENNVILEIGGELVEINVNCVNGKKLISLIPLTETGLIDCNENIINPDEIEEMPILTKEDVPYENADANLELPKLDIQMSTPKPEDKTQDEEIGDEIIIETIPFEVQRDICSIETVQQEEVVQQDFDTLYLTDKEIINENEIVIDTTQEDIVIPFESNQSMEEETTPKLCTKASKKMYDDQIAFPKINKEKQSLRTYRKPKNKEKERKRLEEKTKGSEEEKTEKPEAVEKPTIKNEKLENKIGNFEAKLTKEIKTKVEKRPSRINGKRKSISQYQKALENLTELRKSKKTRQEEITKNKQLISSLATTKKPKLHPKVVDKQARKNPVSGTIIKKDPKSTKLAIKYTALKNPNDINIRKHPQCITSNDDNPKINSKESIILAKATLPKEIPYKLIPSSPLNLSGPKTTTPSSLETLETARTTTQLAVYVNTNIKTQTDVEVKPEKKKLSIEEYNSRKRKIVDKPLEIFQKVTKSLDVDESVQKPVEEKTIYAARIFDKVKKDIKDPRIRFSASKAAEPTNTSLDLKNAKVAHIKEIIKNEITKISEKSWKPNNECVPSEIVPNQNNTIKSNPLVQDQNLAQKSAHVDDRSMDELPSYSASSKQAPSNSFSNSWEDSNSPKHKCLTDVFLEGFLDKNRCLKQLPLKQKCLIDPNEFGIAAANSEAPRDESLQNYKDQVDSKLSSLNITIPKQSKMPMQKRLTKNEDDILMRRFLKREKLTPCEISRIKQIIYLKKMAQHLSQNRSSPVNGSTYQIQTESERDEMKLHLRKVNEEKLKKRKKRFRNLHSRSPDSSDSELSQTAGDYSVYQSSLEGVPKLIFKRKTDLIQPFVRLERSSVIDTMAKNYKSK